MPTLVRWAPALFLLLPLLSPAQTVVLNEDFESGTGTGTFTSTATINGTNLFAGGTAAGNGPSQPGTRAAFVACTSCTGGPYRYSTTSETVSYLYRNVTLPTGFNNLELSFDWKGQGLGDVAPKDYLAVYLLPASYALTRTLPTGPGVLQLATLSLQGNYAPVRIVLPEAATLAGTTCRLAFVWVNDALVAGTQPPAAIDNVRLTANTRPVLTGTYTVNNTLPTSGRNFGSVTEAVEAVNSGAYVAPVTFEVQAGQVFAEDVPALMASGTAAGRITFRRAGSGANPILNPLGGPTARYAGFDLVGTDYVTFDGIDVAATGTLPLYGYRVANRTATNGARYNEVRNARITLNRAGRPLLSTAPSSVGVLQVTSDTNVLIGGVYGGSTPTDSLGTNRFNRYQNLTIDDANNGVWLVGSSVMVTGAGSEMDLGNQVLNVAIGTAGPGSVGTSSLAGGVCEGISTGFQRRLRVQGCTITGLRAPTGYVGGILSFYLGGYGANASYVTDNRIRDLEGGGNGNANGTYGCLSGMHFWLESAGSELRTDLQVVNNDIRDLRRRPTTLQLSTYDGMMGLIITHTGASTSNLEFYHNTVVIDGSAAPSVSNTAFYGGISGNGRVTVRNNLFANFTGAQSGTQVRHVVMQTTSTASNYNNLYLANATNGYVAGAAPTLAGWQTASGLDAQSVSLDPLFAAASPFLPTNPALDNRGTPLAQVPTDVLGIRRSNVTPDLGAYEFGSIALATGPPALVAHTALYPNPTTGRATLELAGLREQGPVTVELVNVLGQTVQQLSTRPKQGFLTETLNLSGLPTGIYSVRIHAQEGTVVKRLVKE